MRVRVFPKTLRVEIENETRVFPESLIFETEMRVSQKSGGFIPEPSSSHPIIKQVKLRFYKRLPL